MSRKVNKKAVKNNKINNKSKTMRNKVLMKVNKKKKNKLTST